MKIEDMNDSDKKTSASKPFKSNGGSEPQTTKEQVMIMRTEVRHVGKTVDKLAVTVDANRKEAKDDFKTLLARMDAMREEFLARMDAMREEFLARMDANQKEANARMDANQKEANARMDANRKEAKDDFKMLLAMFEANRKEIFKVQLLGAVILAVLLMDSPLVGRVFDKFGLGAAPPAVRQDVAPSQAERSSLRSGGANFSPPASAGGDVAAERRQRGESAATDSPAGGVVKHHLPPPARLRRADSPRDAGGVREGY